jgi:Flp pilus assembly protein protease CpaA
MRFQHHVPAARILSVLITLAGWLCCGILLFAVGSLGA